MIVSIHQPNYIPWLGFFHKMAKCDTFVLLDEVPFSKNSFQNRCSIKTAQGALWLTVPVLTKGHFGQLTNRIAIDNPLKSLSKHWKTIEQSYRRAPFFAEVAEWLQPIYQAEWKLLVDLNVSIILAVSEKLGIRARICRASSLGVHARQSELLLAICRALGAEVYLSGPSGRKYLQERLFINNRIAVEYDEFAHPTYPQLYSQFLPRLSVVDLLMNCGPASMDVLLGKAGVV